MRSGMQFRHSTTREMACHFDTPRIWEVACNVDTPRLWEVACNLDTPRLWEVACNLDTPRLVLTCYGAVLQLLQRLQKYLDMPQKIIKTNFILFLFIEKPIYFTAIFCYLYHNFQKWIFQLSFLFICVSQSIVNIFIMNETCFSMPNCFPVDNYYTFLRNRGLGHIRHL